MKSLFLFVLISAITGLFSQTIENVDFHAEGNMLVVTYNLFHPKPDTTINVTLLFNDQKGTTIIPRQISGDINSVKPGESKRIVWDLLAEGATLSGQLQAKIQVYPFIRENTEANDLKECEDLINTYYFYYVQFYFNKLSFKDIEKSTLLDMRRTCEYCYSCFFAEFSKKVKKKALQLTNVSPFIEYFEMNPPREPCNND